MRWILMFNNSVEKYYKKRSRFFRKNQHLYRQINVFTKEVSKVLISRNFFSVIVFSSIFPHLKSEWQKNLEISTLWGTMIHRHRVFLMSQNRKDLNVAFLWIMSDRFSRSLKIHARKQCLACHRITLHFSSKLWLKSHFRPTLPNFINFTRNLQIFHPKS